MKKSINVYHSHFRKSYILYFLIVVVFSSSSFALDFSSEEENFTRKYLLQDGQKESSSDYVVSILMASQFNLDKQLKNLYIEGHKLGAEDRLWLDLSIKNCLVSDSTMNCESIKIITTLKNLDKDNAVPYVYSALFHIKNNQLIEALQELKSASEKKFYDDYYWKRFSVLLEALTKAGYPRNYLHTASIKFSHHLVVEPYSQLMKLCNEQSKLDLEWKASCLNLGQLLEQKGTIFFAKMVGFALQRQALSVDTNDSTKLNRIKKEREELSQWRINAVRTLDFIEAEKRAPDSYYRDLINIGERKAVENALIEYQKSNKE